MTIGVITCLTLFLTTFAHAEPPDDAYRVLGVPPDASQQELVQAWRKATKDIMPLVNRGNNAALEAMKLINQAYNSVKTAEKRANYRFHTEKPRSDSNTPTEDEFKESNVDEVLASHPHWSSILSNYEAGVAELIAKKDWATLLQIYEVMLDESFVNIVLRKLGQLEDSPVLRDVLNKIIQIESFNHPPHPRVWNLGAMARHVFSKPKFLALTQGLLPKFFKVAHSYDLRQLMRDVFANDFSLPLGDNYLWEIVRRTRGEEDKAALYMMAEWIFRNGETGSKRDPELLVALVQEEGNQIMASRILAWRYRPEWGGRGLQAIIDKADSDALRGLRQRLSTRDFAGGEWDVYRNALGHADADAGPELRKRVGTLILMEPTPETFECETVLGNTTPPFGTIFPY